ncbi:phosphoribosyltransferase [Patescibacteria group bacterium]|nr:phosphoribosyltransferase [Patescibacteria group bacterium]
MIEPARQRWIVEQWRRLGVIKKGHFLLTSGRHSDEYVAKNLIYVHTRFTSELCADIAEMFKDHGVQAVIGPVVGGVALSQWVAYHLSVFTDTDVFSLFADKDNGNFAIKREYDQFTANNRVLVVEDILTTGGSVKKVIDAVRANGGEPVAVAALCNRGGVTTESLGVPELSTLVELKMDTWAPADCELCHKLVPMSTSAGHAKSA